MKQKTIEMIVKAVFAEIDLRKIKKKKKKQKNIFERLLDDPEKFELNACVEHGEIIIKLKERKGDN